MKEIVSQPTNGVICEDGKIAKNGLRVICPFCGEIGLSQGRGGSVNVWTVGAIERRECTKCRKQFHTIALTVPPDMTPEDFYFPGMVRVFALMALWVLFCNLAGAFDYTEPERRKPREVRREDPVARTGRTSRQSPCPSGRAKNYR